MNKITLSMSRLPVESDILIKLNSNISYFYFIREYRSFLFHNTISLNYKRRIIQH